MAKKIRLDFTKVEERSGFNTKSMPEGLHKFKVVEAHVGEAKDGVDMITYSLVPAEDKYKTRRFPFYCKLQPNQLWKLRDLLVAAGVSVPKKALNIDPEAPVGKFIAAEVSDESGQYAGRSTIDGVYDVSILDDEDGPAGDDEDDEEYEGDEDEAEDTDEDEADEAEDEDEDDAEDEVDLTELSLAELRKLAKEYEIDTTGLKKAQLIEAIEEAQDEDGDEDDEDEDLDDEELDEDDLGDEELEDDEEEEPAPAPKRRPAKAAATKAAPAKSAPAKRTVKRR